MEPAERHRLRKTGPQSPPSTEWPSQRHKRSRARDDDEVDDGGDGEISPGLSGSTVADNTSLSVAEGSDMFSTDDTMNFDDLQDFSMPDMHPMIPNIDPALEGTMMGPRDNVVNYLEPGNFKVSLGNPPPEQKNSSAESGSPLHMAVLKGSGKIVQLLLKHGADCNARDGNGLTPLIHAVIEEQEDIADMLLSHGARIQVVDNYQRSPLHWTVLKRRERLLKVLIKHCEQNGDIINAYDVEGSTPLHIAINLELDSAVQMLLEAGADAKAPIKLFTA